MPTPKNTDTNSDPENVMNNSQSSRRRFIKKALATTAGVAVGGSALTLLLKPADAGGAYSRYFSDLNGSLKKAGIGRPCMVLDLNRVDHNISQVMKRLQPPLDYRVVTKSLPSEELLNYVLKKTGVDRVMAFHQPFLDLFCRNLGEADILLGKPLLIASVREFYKNQPPERWSKLSKRIQWLVDTEERLQHTLRFAEEKNLLLRINLEIDVGLRRGGASNHGDLDRMLPVVASHPDHLRFAGFMGYKAHVPFAPPIISSVDGAFKEAMDAYSGFYEYGRSRFPELFDGDLTLNSGGSTTYQMFPKNLPVNDIAAGSCMVKPSTFGMPEDHQPALFIAAPVIKKMRGPLGFLSRFRCGNDQLVGPAYEGSRIPVRGRLGGRTRVSAWSPVERLDRQSGQPEPSAQPVPLQQTRNHSPGDRRFRFLPPPTGRRHVPVRRGRRGS
ncbi:MAG: twin-arginine translocation signal domain-containing protein [Proteobacteria bacterium]|nr:twin-arginine translocation signal domain-containing protein [Pseudomonadota bacterium]